MASVSAIQARMAFPPTTTESEFQECVNVSSCTTEPFKFEESAAKAPRSPWGFRFSTARLSQIHRR